ncbi:PREDICTED: F-box/kelch-repeat protein At1g48625-like [Camelina sativa]|uniref:F-box/kelch-repeat protein At1g48625-like n=1 Tax=Camelina sativa TaxID=90675 RepID=A0ABM0X5H5_CAMSA|nr:PREDICTED: F-box/kelch-repeat protein At1g48625-like [Camelina sativa]
MTTMISNLPRDLIEEILSRVPLKSMRTLRLTCKKWGTILRSESFTKLHISKATTREGESTMITLINNQLYLTSVVVRNDVDPYTEPRGKLMSERQVKISQVFYCEGLLLCILNETTVTRFVVWNPYLGQTRWIKPRYSHRKDMFGKDRFHYSLGYVSKKSCRSHKFLRFIDYHRYQYVHQFFWYEIYDFDSDLWTTLDVTPHWFIPYKNSGISLKGNTYWAAEKRENDYSKYLICFDFTRERFGPLLPLPFSVRDHAYMILSCVKEEKLAALIQRHETHVHEFEIWITTKLEDEMVSWSMFLRINTWAIRHESFVIDEEKKITMGSNKNLRTINIIGEAGYFRELDLGEHVENNCLSHVCSYVPSSVQIKELAQGNRKKRQSNLENRRFKQNMSRLVAFEKAVRR